MILIALYMRYKKDIDSLSHEKTNVKNVETSWQDFCREVFHISEDR